MVTPEMLLFLAGKMGLERVSKESRGVVYFYDEAAEDFDRFNPATDDAQFGRLVVWAAMQGLYIGIHDDGVVCGQSGHRAGRIGMAKHDSTPDSIRAAAVVAIVRALGWEGESNAAT